MAQAVVPSLSIQEIIQWKDKKKQELKNGNPWIIKLKEIDTQNMDMNGQITNQLFAQKANSVKLREMIVLQLKDLRKVSLFIDFITDLCEKNYPNHSQLVDLYLELVTLKLEMINHRDDSIHYFSPKDILFSKQSWKLVEDQFNIEAKSKGTTKENYVGYVESTDTKTIIIMNKLHLKYVNSKHPVIWLSMQCIDSHKNEQ